MRSCFVLLFASLLTSCEAQGTFKPIGFVLKGRDLLLELDADPPEGLLYVDWKVNKTVDLVRFDPSGKATVTEKFELGRKNFSVILKNLQEVDSGVYSAVAVTDTGDKLVSEYKVTVQGPVSPVNLTVDRVDSSSSESCDLHVTCRTHNSHISSTFRCVDWFCSQEGGEGPEVTTSGASLQVYLLNNVIICNHRNKVHWTQDLIPAEHFCSKPDPPLHSGWMIAIYILIVIMFLFLIVWFIHQMRTIRYGRRFIERIQKAVQRLRPAPPQDESPEDPAPGLGRRFEDLVRAVVQDKKGTNSSEEAGAESKSLDTTTQTVVQPLLSSDQHETHQSNIKISAPPRMSSLANNTSDVGRRFEDLVREALLEELERQWQDHLNKEAASREKMEELELLNETRSSSSFVKPDAGSIQPESGFGREDSL